MRHRFGGPPHGYGLNAEGPLPPPRSPGSDTAAAPEAILGPPSAPAKPSAVAKAPALQPPATPPPLPPPLPVLPRHSPLGSSPPAGAAAQLEAAAARLAAGPQPIAVTKVDAEKHATLARKYRIRAYPTLILVSQGKVREYGGSTANADALVAGVRRLLEPEVSVLTSDDAVARFVEDRRGGHLGVFLGFGIAESVIQALLPMYRKRASFAVVPNVSEGTLMEFELDREPAVVAMHPREREQEVFYGPVEDDSAGGAAELAQFVRRNYLPMVNHLTEATFSYVTGAGRRLALIVADFGGLAPDFVSSFSSVSERLTEQRLEELSQGDEGPVAEGAVRREKALRLLQRVVVVARRHRDFTFAYMDMAQHPEFLKQFRVTHETDLPVVLVWDLATSYHVFANSAALLGEDMELSLNRFLEDIALGALRPLTTAPEGLGSRAYKVLMQPNIAFVLLIVLVAVTISRKRGWRPVVIRDISDRAMAESGSRLAKLQRQQREAEEQVAGAADGMSDDANAVADKVVDDKKRD
eukprot:SM000093S24441  [mRNA]  locus=s93:358249:361556:- [translate_table: standard]